MVRLDIGYLVQVWRGRHGWLAANGLLPSLASAMGLGLSPKMALSSSCDVETPALLVASVTSMELDVAWMVGCYQVG